VMRIRRTLEWSLEMRVFCLRCRRADYCVAPRFAADLRSFFGTQIFSSIIPRNVGSPKPKFSGKPIIFYDLLAKGPRAIHNRSGGNCQ